MIKILVPPWKEFPKMEWHLEEQARAKSSYGTCDEVGRAKNQELIWNELLQNSKNQ